MSRRSHAYALLQHLYQALLLNQRRTGARACRTAMVDILETRTLLNGTVLSYTVTSTADFGPGSLRDAIEQANAHAGKDQITFDIPGSGVQTIVPLTPLPTITDALDITGATQPGYSGSVGVAAAPVVWIDGRTLPRDNEHFSLSGLNAKATVAITALGIAGFEHNINLAMGADYSTVNGCYLGIDPTGQIDWQIIEGAAVDGVEVLASHVTIGGASADQQNVIAGSGYAIQSFATFDDTGIAAIAYPDYLTIQGNYLGINVTGDTVVSSDGENSGVGTVVLFAAGNALIGGPNPGEGNVIGSESNDILMWGCRNGIVQNNNLQIKPNGIEVIASPIAPYGCIEIDGSWGYGTLITGNVMGGNQGNGILFAESAHDNIAQGNYIGVDRSVTYNLGRPDNYNGIYFVDSTSNTATGNIIGNFRKGIRVGYPDVAYTTGNTITGNYVGMGPAGQDIGNRGPGILVGWGDNNIIGGINPGEANIVANNGTNPAADDPAGGIVVMLGTGNTIRGNKVYNDAGIGIDLGGEGVTPNDSLDTDTGANNRQNTPIMDSVFVLTVPKIIISDAHLNSAPNTTYTIDFYAGLLSSHGGVPQAARWLYSCTVTTDSGGYVSFHTEFPWSGQRPTSLLATATDPAGNTSEFSYLGNPPLSLPRLSFGDISVVEGNSGTIDATFTFTLDRPSDQDVLVDVYTEDNTATSGSDYQSISTTVTIPAGAITATVIVPVNGDTLYEPDETFTLNLLDVTNAVAGNWQAVGTILNDDVLIDAGGTFASAQRVGNGTEDPSSPIAAEINPGNDVDLYYFTVQAGTTATFIINSHYSGLDSYLRLFDHNGNELAANDDWKGLDSQITYTFTETGTYYIGVSGLDNTSYNPVDGSGAIDGSTGAYTLNISGLPMQDVIGDYDRFSDAWLVDNNQPLRTTIAGEGDYDLYHISINPGDPLTRRFSADAAFGTTLKIFDASGTELYNSSANAGFSGQTLFTFSGSGDYYVGISGQGNNTYNPVETYPTTLPGSQGEYTFTMQSSTLLIPDAGLEAAIRNELINNGHGIDPATPLTPADMRDLWMLDARYDNITSLEGLQDAINLQRLFLWGNSITDLTPIAGLSLDILEVADNPTLADLSPIAGMTSLSQIHASETAVSSLAPLADLTSLQFLNLYGDPVVDVSPLAGLTNLMYLSLGSTNINNLTPLAGLSSLVNLDLSSTFATDLSPLAGLTNLTFLGLESTAPVSLAPLHAMSSLDTLRLSATGITDVTLATLDWSHLSSLTVLTLDSNPISDLTPISAATSLITLLVDSDALTTLAPVASLTSLRWLHANSNQISDISALSGLHSLTDLGVGGNQITSIAPLAGLTAMVNLDIPANQITDLSPISGMMQLQWLNAGYNQIPTLTNVNWANLPNLTQGGLFFNRLASWPEGADAPILAMLYARGFYLNQVQTVVFADANFEAAVRALTYTPAGQVVHSGQVALLTTLNLSNTPITSIQGIEYATGLNTLDLRHTGLNLSPGSPDRARVDLLLARGVSVLFNTAPTVSFSGMGSLNEGSIYTGSGSFVDPEADTWTATVDYGDGSGVQALALQPDHSFALSHRYDDNGVFTIKVSVNDGTDIGSLSLPVTVNSVAPSGMLGRVGAAVEGVTATFKFGGQHDPSLADTAAGFTYSYSLDGGLFVPGTATYLLPGDRIPDGPSTHTLRGRISDKDGATSEYALPFSVQNAIPTVTIPAAAAISVGGTYTASGSFADSGTLDTWTARVSYGDRGGLQSQPLALAGKTFALSHVYVSAGVFAVTVWVTDKDGATGMATRLVTVNQLPPQITGIIVNDGASAQRSMVTSITCNFSSVVTLDAGAFSLIRSDGQAVALSYVTGPAASFRLTFTNGPLEGASLADGRYTFSVIGSKVHLGGTTMAGVATQSITRLFGDSDGDGDVDSLDVKSFTLAYNKSRNDPAYQWYFDLDSNNVIDANDYKAFRLRLNKSV